MSERGVVRVDQYLAHAPAKVWRALTDPELLGRWLMPNDFKPVVGHRFTFHTTPRPQQEFDGVVHCEVLELAPRRLLRIAWRGGRLDTTLTWTLVPEGRGTRLLLEHAGFDPDDPVQLGAYTLMGGGWRARVLPALERVLAETG
ncbi:SRPBCC domain-containing protein [Micromonospora sp. NPDC049559]|uniref:SRPBCC family protein n=1 Tax=Micromonospora sp. NPDC049559 TaxID=3155923 RepID=UPI00341B3524